MEAAASPTDALSYVRRHHPTGASTGWFVEERGDWPSLVARALAESSFAVELSALTAAELPALVEYLDVSDPLPFAYVGVHGPAQGWTGTDADLADALVALTRSVDALVMHPESLGDADAYRRLGRVLTIENMDPRKADGRTKEELAVHFDRFPEAGFVFDVAHAAAVDPDLDLAHELLDAFGPRLRHVHLSSLDDECRHVPLSPDDAMRFAPVLARCRGVPWMLEAPLGGPRWDA